MADRSADEREIALEKLEQSLLEREQSHIETDQAIEPPRDRDDGFLTPICAHPQATEQREEQENTLEEKELFTEKTEFSKEQVSHKKLMDLLQKHKNEDVREESEIAREAKDFGKEHETLMHEQELHKKERVSQTPLVVPWRHGPCEYDDITNRIPSDSRT